LGLTGQAGEFYTVEMINRVQEFFSNNPNISVLFLFEDIDYYIETTKQVLLYKILDMLTYVKIKFVFLATSMKLDVADGFEKRIKSRFSHR
jgi:Cdc6-like AAA superfamily ATPase